MPVFYLLALISIVLLWFLIAFLYKPIGKFFMRLFKDSMDAMKEETEDKEKDDNA